METVARNLDLAALDTEIARCTPIMQAIGQDVQAAKEYILEAMPKALEPISNTRFRFDFLASPTRMVGDKKGHVCGLEVENTTLVLKDSDTKARGLGTKRILDVDTVIFCIGDRVDEGFGLPVQWNEYVKNPNPRFPVNGLSYEAFDPQAGKPIEGVFVAGWSREASSGLVGVARKDGENGARSLCQYLETLPPLIDDKPVLARLDKLLQRSGKKVVTKADVSLLEAFEQTEANRLGLEEYKMKTNEEMLNAIGMVGTS
jgi:ferredoxin--NADP+ reductase